jgi:phosphoribosyl-AMP cyclohydrolase
LFEKAGQQLVLNMPTIEIYHSESEYKQTELIDNKDILDVIEADFDNVEAIFSKYFNEKAFQETVGKTGFNRHSIPPQD